jgi:DNA-binding CsgD family transcriptional regulator
MGSAHPPGQSSQDRRAHRERRSDDRFVHARAHCLSAAFDVLCHPILILIPGNPLRIWYANAAARSHPATGDVLTLGDDDVRLTAGENGQALGRALRMALLQGPGFPQVIEFAAGPGKAVTHVHIDALDPRADFELPYTRMLLVEVRRRTAPADALARLCRDFGLTPKEAEIALGLYASGSVEQLAQHARKSVHTVRTQLKAAMHKTATRSQAGLVALIGSRLAD